MVDAAKKYIAQGFRHVRIQVGVPGMAGYGAARPASASPPSTMSRCSSAKRPSGAPWRCSRRPASNWAREIELLHDAHERYTPTEAVQLAKEVEQYRLFFLEDPLSPEDIMWFQNIRAKPHHAAGHGRAVQFAA